MTRPTCGTCRWWENENSGECHRNPPAMVPENDDYYARWQWPEVHRDDYCGEHAERAPLAAAVPTVAGEMRQRRAGEVAWGKWAHELLGVSWMPDESLRAMIAERMCEPGAAGPGEGIRPGDYGSPENPYATVERPTVPVMDSAAEGVPRSLTTSEEWRVWAKSLLGDEYVNEATARAQINMAVQDGKQAQSLVRRLVAWADRNVMTYPRSLHEIIEDASALAAQEAT